MARILIFGTKKHAREKGVPFPGVETRSLDDVLKETKQSDSLDREGYVARFNDGRQVKIKYQRYTRVLKTIFREIL